MFVSWKKTLLAVAKKYLEKTLLWKQFLFWIINLWFAACLWVEQDSGAVHSPSLKYLAKMSCDLAPSPDLEHCTGQSDSQKTEKENLPSVIW